MTSGIAPVVMLTFVTYRTTGARGDCRHIAALRGDAPRNATSPAMNAPSRPYPTHAPKPNPSPRAEHQRREPRVRAEVREDSSDSQAGGGGEDGDEDDDVL
jgi:hypothetical protein